MIKFHVLYYKKKFYIRNPNSTRPWQHVLEPLRAYLVVAAKLTKIKKNLTGESFNVGPNQNKVLTVVQLIKKIILMLVYW